MLGRRDQLHPADLNGLLAPVRDDGAPEINDMADVKVAVLGGDRGSGCEDIAGVLLQRLKVESTVDVEPATVVQRVHPLLRKVVNGDNDSNYPNPSYR